MVEKKQNVNFHWRHGQSLFNLESRIGGDPELSEEGQKYAKKLHHFISLQYRKEDIIIFTSNLKRTKSTAKYFMENDYKVIHKEILNEIHGGICENLTYDEVKENMPDVYESRKKDKFHFKYPQGESYNDLIVRLIIHCLINCVYLVITHYSFN